MSIHFTLFQVLGGTEVEVGLYTLGGQRVWQQVLEVQRAGPQEVVDGMAGTKPAPWCRLECMWRGCGWVRIKGISINCRW